MLRGIEHVAQPADRAPEKPVRRRSRLQCASKARSIARSPPRSFCRRNASSRSRIASAFSSEIERGAVIEERAPLRIERHEIERAPPRSAPLRQRCAAAPTGTVRIVGPMSKRKPSCSMHGRLAAEPRVRSRKARRMPACRQRAGRGQPAESAADDPDSFHVATGKTLFSAARNAPISRFSPVAALQKDAKAMPKPLDRSSDRMKAPNLRFAGLRRMPPRQARAGALRPLSGKSFPAAPLRRASRHSHWPCPAKREAGIGRRHDHVVNRDKARREVAGQRLRRGFVARKDGSTETVLVFRG